MSRHGSAGPRSEGARGKRQSSLPASWGIRSRDPIFPISLRLFRHFVYVFITTQPLCCLLCLCVATRGAPHAAIFRVWAAASHRRRHIKVLRASFGGQTRNPAWPLHGTV